jgi:hypothetical protein
MTKSSTGNDTSAITDRHNAVPLRFTSDDGATFGSRVADMNGKLLEGVAASTKEWGDFLNRNRRLAANMAVPQQLAEQ